MPFEAFPYLFAVFLAFVVLVGVVGYVQAKRRREALQAHAATRGWTWIPSDDALVDRFAGRPFGVGSSRRTSNVLTGTHDGRPMLAFDYRYTTSSGTGKDRSTTTHVHSVVALNLGASLPALAVEPEGMFGRLIGRLTERDIELESEDFNRAFTVTCPSRKFASDVLHPQLMELLLRHPDFAWRFERDSMLVVATGEQSVEEIDARLALMDQIIDAVPEFVWSEVKGS